MSATPTNRPVLRRNGHQQRVLLHRFELSRLSAQDFCRQEGLSLSSFRRRQHRQAVVTSTPGFVELQAPATATVSDDGPWATELRPAGRRPPTPARRSLMHLRQQQPRILARRDTVEMHKSFDGLVGMVRDATAEEPLSGSLFVFVNRGGGHLKYVYWDRTGFALFAKRLDRGRFVIPGSERAQQLSVEQFHLICDGIIQLSGAASCCAALSRRKPPRRPWPARRLCA